MVPELTPCPSSSDAMSNDGIAAQFTWKKTRFERFDCLWMARGTGREPRLLSGAARRKDAPEGLDWGQMGVCRA